MLLWLQQNIGTILVCIVLLRSSCGNNCSHCAMHGQCHNTH